MEKDLSLVNLPFSLEEMTYYLHWELNKNYEFIVQVFIYCNNLRESVHTHTHKRIKCPLMNKVYKKRLSCRWAKKVIVLSKFWIRLFEQDDKYLSMKHWEKESGGHEPHSASTIPPAIAHRSAFSSFPFGIPFCYSLSFSFSA